ncbi:MAG TPA: DUF4936 family protein [Burkholderiaceae bacterium]
MHTDSCDCYVYYKVRTGDGALLRERVAGLQQRLRTQWGVACSLKRRPHSKDGLDTWMEVYLAAPEGFERGLARELQESRVQELIDGERHMEYFLDLTSCA